MGSSPGTMTGAGAAIKAVHTRADFDTFIRLPWRLYRGDPNWVPPLLKTQRELFSPKHNPFHQHADIQLFLALKDGRVAGRISAQVDHEHNRYHSERTGFFGFFESENDPDLAGALLAAAEDWLRGRGMDRARGPLSFSINGEVGLLAEGFDSPPFLLMPYTPRYYLDLLAQAGYAKVKDIYAWHWAGDEVTERVARAAEALRRRADVRVRTMDMRRYQREIATILEIFNDGWSDNWGFVPATPAEARQLARELRPIVDPHIAIFVEVNGEPAAVGLAVPNLNEAIKDLDGRLFPLGLVKLLWRVKVRRLKTGRLLLLGIRKRYRTRQYAGVALLIGDEIRRRGVQRGYQAGELSWTLEDNHVINSAIAKAGYLPYKTYRLFEKGLAP